MNGSALAHLQQPPASEPDTLAARPLVFGSGERSLFGWYHPAAAARRACGVVLCNPLGVEALRVHRAYRVLAERLAGEGFPVLRFDHDGTGNSSRTDADPDRLAAWTESVRDAIDELKSCSGVAEVSLFGVRLGGTLAMLAAARRADVSSVILWGAAARGRAYVREVRAFGMMQQEGATPLAPTNSDDGIIEVAGFVLTRATADEISKVDLLATSCPSLKAALVLARDDLPGEKPLADALAQKGVAVSYKEPPGYAALMRDPHASQVPQEVFSEIASWLVARHPVETGALGGGGAHRPRGGQPRAIELEGCREAPVRFGDDRELFGIVTEPLFHSACRPAVLLLNVGSNHHIGPNRMSVRLARELGGRGFLTLRFDVKGLGDSAPAPAGREQHLYSKDSIKDAQAAMRALEASHGVNRFVVVGLCSGAYLAFYLTLADARVAGQVLINAQTFHWRDGDTLEVAMRRTASRSTRFYEKALFDRRTWERLARGDVNLKAVARILATRAIRRVADRVRPLLPRRGAAHETNVAAAFREVSKRGADAFLIYSAEDGGLDEIERWLGHEGRRMRARDNFRFATIEGADHTFTPRVTRDRLIDLITQHIQTKFA